VEGQSQTSTQNKGSESKGDYGLPLSGFKVSSRFGKRGSEDHGGIDLAIKENSPIQSVYDGVVTKVWNDTEFGGGLSILVKHSDGTTAGYAHLNRQDVKPGQKISKGDIIGLTGNTGRKTSGAHLHFTFRNQKGERVDPESVFNFEQ
jgi:murein DD-endopeptidase